MHVWPTDLQILKSWEAPAPPTKKLTQNRFQFLGMITSEYLDQIRPGGEEQRRTLRSS